MATIYDVAKRAQVSTYTVSAVLNRSAKVSPKLTQRVNDAVRELNFTLNELARSLQSNKTRTISMLIPDIANHFYARVVRGAKDVLRKSGYSLILVNTYNREEEQTRYLTIFRAKQVDGILLFVAPGPSADVQPLVRDRKPVVFVGRTPSGYSADSVSADNVKGAKLAVDYLIKQGHKRIALITGPLSLSTGADRVAGWRSALRQAGLKADKTLVGEGDWSSDSGYRQACAVLDSGETPTAICVANFPMMTGALRALKERKIPCPRKCEVVSSDDSDWRRDL